MQVCLNDDDFSGVLGDALTPPERVRVAVHVAECPTCRAELRRRRAAPGNAGSARPAPDPGPADPMGPVLPHSAPGAGIVGQSSRS